MVDHRLGALGNSLHELLFCYAPHVIRAFRCMYFLFPHTAICAAYAYVLITSSEASHCMPFEMGQYKE